MNPDKTFLGTQPVGKLLLKLAIPSVIAQIVNMLYNIVDRIYIGHIPETGSLALTGLGVCMPLILIVSAFAAFVSSGGAPRASIAMGKGDHETAQRILGGCFTMQILISAVLTAVLLIWGRDLLLLFGASENTIDFAASYMNIYAIGTIFVQLLRALVPPLIFTAIVASIANLKNLNNAAKLVWQTLLWFAITALIAVVIGIALGLIIQPGLNTTVAET